MHAFVPNRSSSLRNVLIRSDERGERENVNDALVFFQPLILNSANILGEVRISLR